MNSTETFLRKLFSPGNFYQQSVTTLRHQNGLKKTKQKTQTEDYEKEKIKQNCISKDVTDSLICSSKLFLYTT